MSLSDSRFGKYTHALVVLILGAALIALLTVGVFWMWSDFADTRRQAESDAEAAALLLEEHADHALQVIDSTLLQTADLVKELGVDGMASAAVWQRLRSLALPLPSSGVIFVYDLAGDAIAGSVSYPPPTSNVADRDYFRKLVSGEAEQLIGGALRGRTVHRWFFPVARSVRDREGKLIAIAEVGVETDHIGEVFSRVQLGLGKTFGMYGSDDGKLIARYPAAAQPAHDYVSPAPYFQALAKEPGSKWTGWVNDENGAERVLSARRLKELPLLVTASMPRAQVFAAAQERQRWRAMGLGALALVLTALGNAYLVAQNRLRLGEQERRVTEAQLRENEEQFRAMFTISSIGKAQVDPFTGRFLRVNAALCRFTGYSEGELLERSVADITHPDDRERDAESLRCLAAGAVNEYDAEKRYIRKDGTMVWGRVTANPIRDRQGKPLRNAAIIQDISQSKRAEEALCDREAHLQNRNRQLDFLARTAQRLLAGGGSERVLLETVFGEIAELIDMEMFYHYRPRPEQRLLCLETHGGIGEEERSRFATMPYGELLCGRVAEWRKTILVEDLQHSDHPGSDVLRAAGATSYAGFPLLAHDELVGTIAFISRKRTHLREGDVQMIQTVCDQLATTLERTRLARELSASEERVRLALEGADLGSWDVDTRTGKAVWNRRHALLQGYDPDRAPASIEAWRERVYPDDLDQVMQAVERAPRERTAFAEEHRFYRADNHELRWLSLFGRFFYDESGEPVRFSGVSLDITERKRAEAALQESEERLRLFIENAPAAIAMFDRDLHYLAASRRWMTDLLPGVNEVIGRGHYELFPDLPEHWKEAHRRGLAGEVVARDEDEHQWPNGSTRWNRWEVRPWRTFDGNIGGILILAENITERKRAEHALRDYADQLKEADKRKDDFIAMLSHELRNPLAPISSAAQILKTAPASDSRIQWCQEVIEKQTQQMARLMEDLLDMSRITRDKLELRKERVDLRSIINAAIETSRPLTEENGHTLTVDLPQEKITLDGDAARLTQVISNLINNACKYSERGGQIEIVARGEWRAVIGDRQEATGNSRPPAAADVGARLIAPSDLATNPSPLVIISVKDTGIGIAPEVLPHLFERFYQAESGKERRYGGLGIGLSLVRGIVELHGGTVEARSDGVGKGSEFVVRLPIVASAEEGIGRQAIGNSWDKLQFQQSKSGPADENQKSQMKDPSCHTPETTRKRVVVVDDNRVQAQSLAMLIEMMGFEARYAFTGADALKLIMDHKPDVALIDIGLPDIKGYEVAQRLRAMPQLNGIKLIAQTGWGRDEDQAQAKQAGFDHHLTKPIDHVLLEKLLCSALSAS